MQTVDRNGVPIQKGDTLMYCGKNKIVSEEYKTNEDLVPGGILVADFIDGDGTFTANGWYLKTDGYPHWFSGTDFEIACDEDIFTGEVDFF